MTWTVFGTTFNEEVYDFQPPLTVILEKPWSAQSPQCQEALTKLLSAVRQSPESVRMVTQATLDLSAWADSPARIVAFVPPPKGINTNEKITTPKSEIVVAEPLSVLLANEDLKRKFWAAFRTLFPV